jgi:hypothetical protein
LPGECYQQDRLWTHNTRSRGLIVTSQERCEARCVASAARTPASAPAGDGHASHLHSPAVRPRSRGCAIFFCCHCVITPGCWELTCARVAENRKRGWGDSAQRRQLALGRRHLYSGSGTTAAAEIPVSHRVLMVLIAA